MPSVTNNNLFERNRKVGYRAESLQSFLMELSLKNADSSKKEKNNLKIWSKNEFCKNQSHASLLPTGGSAGHLAAISVCGYICTNWEKMVNTV